MLLKRISILASMLLAACVPMREPGGKAASGYDAVAPTKAEAAAWRSAQRFNTAAAYKFFIKKYPKSRHVPAATEKLSVLLKQKPRTSRYIGGGNAASSSY